MNVPLPRTANVVKALKVRLPAELHLRLTRERLLYGKSASEVVQRALATYFAALPPFPGLDLEGMGVPR